MSYSQGVLFSAIWKAFRKNDGRTGSVVYAFLILWAVSQIGGLSARRHVKSINEWEGCTIRQSRPDHFHHRNGTISVPYDWIPSMKLVSHGGIHLFHSNQVLFLHIFECVEDELDTFGSKTKILIYIWTSHFRISICFSLSICDDIDFDAIK